MSDSESYPPDFKSLMNGPTEPDQPGVIQSKDILIPVIDLECLDVEKLREACTEWGIFRVENNGIPSTLMSKVKEITKSMLSLPFDEKRKLFDGVNAPLSYYWGTAALTSSGNATKRAPQASNVNLVEGFNVPLASLSCLLKSSRDDHKLESFRVVMEEYGKHMTRIAMTLFESMVKILSLELSDDRRSGYLSESTGFLRVQRYPPSSKLHGLEPHKDSSVISIINQDEIGGLEFMKDEEWFNVKPIENSLVINLGDMMQAISDDKFKSVVHKVRLRKKKKERYSIAYFVFPDKDCVIKSSLYKPFTYSHFHFQAQVQIDVQTHGFKIGLSRFLL